MWMISNNHDNKVCLFLLGRPNIKIVHVQNNTIRFQKSHRENLWISYRAFSERFIFLEIRQNTLKSRWNMKRKFPQDGYLADDDYTNAELAPHTDLSSFSQAPGMLVRRYFTLIHHKTICPILGAVFGAILCSLSRCSTVCSLRSKEEKQHSWTPLPLLRYSKSR